MRLHLVEACAERSKGATWCKLAQIVRPWPLKETPSRGPLPMQIFEPEIRTVQIYSVGNPLRSMKIHQDPSKSIRIHQNPSRSIRINYIENPQGRWPPAAASPHVCLPCRNGHQLNQLSSVATRISSAVQINADADLIGSQSLRSNHFRHRYISRSGTTRVRNLHVD